MALGRLDPLMASVQQVIADAQTLAGQLDTEADQADAGDDSERANALGEATAAVEIIGEDAKKLSDEIERTGDDYGAVIG